MALKKQYARQDEVPEALRPLYKEAGGKWVLELEDDEDGDAHAKKKLAEFRDIAKKERDEKEALAARLKAYGDIDPETLTRALDALSRTQNDEELQLVKSGRLDEVVTRRTKAMQEQAQRKIEDLTRQRDTESKAAAEVRNRYAAMAISQEVQRAIAAKKLQVKPTALEDINMRATRAWKVADDLSLQANFVLPTGDDPTMDRFVDNLLESAPHLFAESEGGGVRPGALRGGGVTKVKASSLSAIDFAKMAPQIAAGKVVVE